MREFTDAAGKVWQLNITVGAVKRVREATDVLLTAMFDNEMALLGELSKDVIKLVDVLFTLCREQAEAENIDAEKFAERLGGDSLGEAGEALVRATADFFTSPEQRAAMHQMVDTLNAAAAEFLTATATKIRAMDAKELGQSCSDFVMSTLAKPALTPTPELLANCS